jgi:hypothetical protein
MGNALAGRRRVAKVMTVDGATFRYKIPATAGAALRGHPGHHLLESQEVRRLGVRTRPLDRDAALKPGKLYFLVQIPGGAGTDDDPRAPRKTWSGALHVGARERLESLTLSRRTVSDVTALTPSSAAARAVAGEPSSVEVGLDGAVRLRMRLPKAEVARLMKESRDTADAAEKILQLCVARDQGGAGAPGSQLGGPALVSAMSGRKTDPKKEVSIMTHLPPSRPLPCLTRVVQTPNSTAHYSCNEL